jgi:hypothetical protein
MDFGLVALWDHGCCCFCEYFFVLQALIFAAFCKGMHWVGSRVYYWNKPWFESDVTRIEFPLPPLVTKFVQPLPVELMVGNCGKAKRCAYCHEEFDHDSARRLCFSCGSVTHNECIELNGGCSVFGCEESFPSNL